MQIWRLCRLPYAADAFSGEGSRLFGGRWNSRGTPMVYASTSLALAAIELFVHLEPNQMPTDLVSITAEIPAADPPQRWDVAHLPSNWWGDELAPTRTLGDAWIRNKQSLAVLVPSVPIRQEWNILLNPLHLHIAKLKIDPPEPFTFDARMFLSQ